MRFQTGFNKPHDVGIYVTADEKYIWDYKIFHENTKTPTVLIATELRTGEFLGPIQIEVVDLKYNFGVKKVLDEKSKLMG